MSGHSKWSTIKHKKASLDAKRGKVFTKIIKEITVAARAGGGDPTGNPRLRFLLDKAKAANMPQDNALRAIKKGTGELPGVQYEAILYEGYGPNNVAVLIEVLTDNRNKAIAELRHFFSRQGGRMAEAGSVSWMFERCGVIHVAGAQEDQLIELLLEYPVRDIKSEDEVLMVTSEPSALEPIKLVLTQTGLTVKEAEIEWIAKNTVALDDAGEQKVVEFLDGLEELDDVQNVYANLG